jgi:quinolinate synthase
MAESADILTPEDVAVILPDLSAGCSMADMADYEQTCRAWEEIAEALDETAGPPTRLIPITYMNSTAAIKAFVGQHSGAVCTSSNAATVFEWAFAGGDMPLEPGEEVKIIFLPDQHLGRNTAHSFGFVTEVDSARTGEQAETALWDPKQEFGGLTPEQIRSAKILLWKGHCSVHMLFRPEHVETLKADDPAVRIIVHPECMQEVVDLADDSGSTEYILKTLRNAPPGSHWAVGTEHHLVNRIALEMAAKDVTIESVSGCQCLCTTMYRISPQRLLWSLNELAAGRVVNQVRVHPDARKWSLLALERMLSLGADMQSAKAKKSLVPA